MSLSPQHPWSIANEREKEKQVTPFLISARPDAPDGEVRSLPSYSTSTFDPLRSSVLCRNNAPLVSFVLQSTGRGLPAYMAGKSLAYELENLIAKLASTNIPDLVARAATWKAAKCQRAENVSRDPSYFIDLHDSLVFFCERAKSIPELTQLIRKSFSDIPDPSRLRCSTIHRAKGLEWDHVFILDRGLLPSKYATSAAALTQERNLHYVAITRARLTVSYIASNCWR